MGVAQSLYTSSPSDPHSVRGRNPCCRHPQPRDANQGSEELKECLRSHSCEAAEPGFRPSSPAPEHTSLTVVPHCLRQVPPILWADSSLQACIQAALCLELAPYLLCMKLAPPPCLPVAVTSFRKPSLMSCIKSNPSPWAPQNHWVSQNTLCCLCCLVGLCIPRSDLLEPKSGSNLSLCAQRSAWGSFRHCLS